MLKSVVFIFISSFMALFPVSNPAGAGLLVSSMLSRVEEVHRMQLVRRVVVAYALIGLGSLVVGHLVLMLFGLSLPVIQTGGGLLICRTAWQWLGDSDTTLGRIADVESSVETVRMLEQHIFYPITFPITIGPGTISVILTLMASTNIRADLRHSLLTYAIIALTILLMAAILYLFLKHGQRVMRRMGGAGGTLLNKMVAFFTFCVGVQIVAKGASALFRMVQ